MATISVLLLGLCTGLRTMTPAALVSWCAHLGYMPVQGTWAAWIASPITVGVFTLLAIGEYIGDKLPSTPSRIAPFPLIARLTFGGLVGALIAAGLHASAIGCVALGIIGAALGAFAGYYARRSLTTKVGWRDLPVALAEDAVTLVLSCLALRVVCG